MMKSIAVTAGALLIGMSALTAPSQAQATCAKHGDVSSQLKKNYAEIPVSVGLASNGTVVQVFASDQGSFTIVMVRPDGLTCLVAAGEGWEALPKTGAGNRT